MLPPIAISSHATVRDLKLRLQTLNADFAFNRQKLIINEPDSEGECEGVVLLNHQTLYSYHMTESTNVVLVMSAKLDVVEVYIDDALKDAERFAALLGDPNLRAMSIKDDIIFRHPTLLLQLFEVNLAVQSIKISGRWTEEHLRFCESLIELRPGIDIRFVVNRSTELKMMLRVAHFCQLNQCSSIQMSNVGLGIEKCRELAPALHSMSSLQHLDLGGNHIVNEGCRALASALQSMSLLQTLDLDNNLIGDSGCSALAIALQSMSSSLQTLNFDANRICVAGCLAMAPALKSMTSLQTLRLRYNSIGDEGCVALAPALKSMPSLKILDLSANYIGASGCRTLAPALQTLSLLQILDLGDLCRRLSCAGTRAAVDVVAAEIRFQFQSD
jgi:Ran GTPase-activating protein (RanGAP) involved in mRNA processing and transport